MIYNRHKKTSRRLYLLASYLLHRTVCRGLPLSAIVSSTSRCNLHCPMCPRAITEFANQDIDFELFRKIVDEGVPFFEFVIPQGGGEPLMHPRIFDLVRYCKSKGLRTGFSTNATLLRGEKLDELLDSGLDSLILAFDGATAETYEKYRQGASFEATRQNILEFLQRKQERKSPIHVTVQMVRLPENQSQIGDFHTMWRIPGVDQIRIKEDEICVEDVCIPSAQAPLRKKLNPCHYLWQGPIYVEENGDVYPCCHAWQAPPLGNVRRETLRDIWNNDRIRAMRAAHIRGDVSAFPECANCRAAKPRLPLIVGSFLVDSFRVRKLIPLFEKISRLSRNSLFENPR
jgi:radical SAM protein with 4Fe4S-binding SPASM domain